MCGSQQTVENSYRDGMPDLLSCLLRNLYTCQEATDRTGHGTTDWFQIRKGVHEGCILSPCLFNVYAEYIMRNAGLEEAQAGMKTAKRNINNLRYADDTTLMAENEELADPLNKSESQVAQSYLTLRAQGLQPTRLFRPWDFPGKSTGVGCHCLLQNIC